MRWLLALLLVVTQLAPAQAQMVPSGVTIRAHTRAGTGVDVSHANALLVHVVSKIDCDNCSGGGTATVVAVSHITSVTHVAAARPLPIVLSPQQGTVPVTAHAGTGSLTVNQGGAWAVSAHQAGTSWTVSQGPAGSAAWPVTAHQAGAWVVNVQHISGAVHLAGSVTDNATSSLRVTNVTLVQANVPHISGVVHVTAGPLSPIHVTANTGSANLTCHSKALVHIAATESHYLAAHGATGLRIFICSVVLVTAAAQNVSIVEGTGFGCGASTRGVIGANHASIALSANGGFSSIAAFPWASTEVAGNSLCIVKSSAAAGSGVSGIVTYRGAP